MNTKEIKRYTVTAALPYANGPLHIGHIAGAYLPADIFVRYLRLVGKDVVFVCGSDEHGAAITLKAKKEGIAPTDIIDKYHKINQQAFADFSIAFDIYHRTSEQLHHQTAQEVFKILVEKEKLQVQESAQFFDTVHQQFLADRYITGTCPKCAHDSAYGDQCEKCGTSLNPSDLIDPKSTLSGSTPELRTTKHWYLPMQDHQEWVSKWLIEGKLDHKTTHDPKTWKNHVLGQCKSWLEQGLQARAMTRDLDWGVKVPLPDADGKVLYVWLDAPIGYISATKAWAAQENKDWRPYWQDEQTALIHFIGKDNIVFHCIIFPIILQATGQYILPVNVPANEFLNLEGNKISTSRNWAVWLHEYLQDFEGKQDVLRYVLTSISPENKDSEFTWKDFQTKNNNELLATLANFVHRALVLAHKYFDGNVPVCGDLLEADKVMIEQITLAPDKISKAIEAYQFKDALHELMNLARAGNKYFAETKPWELATHDLEITGTIIHVGLQAVANLAILMQPFLPDAAQKLAKMIGLKDLTWDFAGRWDLLTAYDRLLEPVHLFEKITDQQVEAQVLKLEKSKLANLPAEPIKPSINFEDFGKIDIRVGTILKAEKMKKTKKLLILQIDTGADIRTVVSGIAQYHEPEQIIGKQVSILCNLEEKVIQGVRSQGMILMAQDRDGSLSFVQPSSPVVNGSEVK